MHFIDLTGLKFGRLTVLNYAYTKEKKHWLCKCECGNEKVINGGSLKRGLTQSCGCLRKELISKRVKTHGMSKTRLYTIWEGMTKRCKNPKYKYYYGKVLCCDEWQKFENFYNWAMANNYADDLTIDRINNDGNYEPNNCRWIPFKEQSKNKTNNHYIEISGRRLILQEWASLFNISRATILGRIKSGWSYEDAITFKPSGINKKPKYITDKIRLIWFEKFCLKYPSALSVNIQNDINNGLQKKEICKNYNLKIDQLNEIIKQYKLNWKYNRTNKHKRV